MMRSPSPAHARAAYTLLELLIATGASLVVGIVALTFSSSSLNLFAKNFSLNESHIRARDVMERATWLLHQCVESPGLVDENGADVGAGPAAGVRVLRYATSGVYRTTTILTPLSTSITLAAIPTGTPVPRVGDTIVLQYQDASTLTNNSGTIQATISGVTKVGSLTTLSFPQALSNYFSPYTSAVWAIPLTQPLSLLTHSAVIAVPKGNIAELRYYPFALTVATDGATAFNNSLNYRVLGELQPLTGATKSLPFSYADAAHRRVAMDIRAISTRYSAAGQKEYNYFETIHSSSAYRSAVQKNLQP